MRSLVCLVLFCLLLQSCSNNKPKVLVFSKTKGFRHQSINVGKPAIQKLGAENGFDVDTTENATAFTEDNLKKYAAVVFLSTTGDVLDLQQQNALKRFIQSGGGYVGVHERFTLRDSIGATTCRSFGLTLGRTVVLFIGVLGLLRSACKNDQCDSKN